MYYYRCLCVTYCDDNIKKRLFIRHIVSTVNRRFLEHINVILLTFSINKINRYHNQVLYPALLNEM